MVAIRIRRKLDSETLHLPELRPLLGREVEIYVHEVQPATAVPGTGDWDAAARASQELRETDYDFDAWRSQRDYDLRQNARCGAHPMRPGAPARSPDVVRGGNR